VVKEFNDMSQYIGGKAGLSLPISTTFGGDDGESNAGKTIAATAGLPGFQMGCKAGPPISAYGSPHIKIKTGGGGTAANKQFNASDGENLVGTGGE
jgi:hypothetical protein